MNWLLICVIGILVVCALEGYFRGFIKIVFSLLAMIITLAVVSVAAPKITTYIEENTELDERITEKCLEHVEKNAQDRLDREAQEKSDQTAVRRKWYQWRRTGCPYGQSGRSGK